MARRISLADSRVEPVVNQGTRPAWRADAGRLRWLLLGTLGVAASACGGKTEDGTSGGLERLGNAGRGGQPIEPQPDGRESEGPDPVPGTVLGPVPPSQVNLATLACAAPVVSLGGGWERCSNGIVHRPVIGECSSPLPRSRSLPLNPAFAPPAADAGLDAPAACLEAGQCCQQDSDCTASPHGYCENDFSDGRIPVNYCQYGCVADSECGVGEVCLCGDPVGACVPSPCTSDADCNGLACTTYEAFPGCGGIAISCQTPEDTCGSDADCSATIEGGKCSDNFRQQDHRSCTAATCTIGRPYLIDGRERLAPSVERDDWYRAPEGDARLAQRALDESDDAVRAAVSQGWLEQALMEHASVAAFARFALQLAALGAPPELLDGAASAMRDEIRHARACFELARRHGDREVGPGPLPLAGALDASSPEEIVVATILEGCIGETVAALEAAEALAACEDPSARAALAEIERDETEHARLAWRFVCWALERGPGSLRAAAARTFEAEIAAASVAPEPMAPSVLDAALLRHGLVPAGLRAALRRRVIEQVVEPCQRALLDGLPPLARAPLAAPVATRA